MTTQPLVYIVDDDEGARTSLAWLLSSVNIRTECYPGPDAFLQAYDPHSQSCLVLDVRMPEISGFQLQEQLNASGAELPVIFVSGHGDIPMSVRALQNGAVDFFEKPYNSQQILDRIQLTLKAAALNHPTRARRQLLRERLKRLSPREREVLDQILHGSSSKVIARALDISVKTVDVHRASIKDKLECDSTASLVRDVLLGFGSDFAKPSWNGLSPMVA
ncbi:response regulator [Rugamonas sp. FT82W]|uniref:Response regulator n=1 Tax=Duganella vulcania TaxID=2692166 RepID=A0A845G4Y4_9BURK|nr:response regulator [Duganella vulcania]MYM89364.1 response regulator [Duganella vulcania]